MPIQAIDEIDASPKTEFLNPEQVPFYFHPETINDLDCLVSNGNPSLGLLVVLDGSKVLKRIGRLVEKGVLQPAHLPLMLGVDPTDALMDYTPWWHPAFKAEAPDFGGGAEAFQQRIVSLVQAARDTFACDDNSASTSLFGYSLAGLFCLNTLLYPSPFTMLLVASPSTWYAGFVNKLARAPLASNPRVFIACGENEGLGHPEPICGIAQDTARTIEILDAKLPTPVEFLEDDLGHHDGLTRRIEALLKAAYPNAW